MPAKLVNVGDLSASSEFRRVSPDVTKSGKPKPSKPVQIEDLAVPSEFRRFSSDGGEILPPKFDRPWPNEIPQKATHDLVQVYQFLTRFSKPLRLSPFLISDLEQCLALRANSRLVDEIFLALCDAIRVDFVGHDFNPFGRKPLQSFPLSALSKYILKNVDTQFHPDKTTLAALDNREEFGALAIERKLKLMSLLWNEVVDTSRIRDAIAEMLDARSKAAARKRGDEAQESRYYQEYAAAYAEAKSKRVLVRDRPDFVKAAKQAIKEEKAAESAGGAAGGQDAAAILASSASVGASIASRRRAALERARELDRRKQLERAQAAQASFDRSVEKTEERIKQVEAQYRSEKRERKLEREIRFAVEWDRHSIRNMPIGTDRYFRRYYICPSENSARVYVQTPILKPEYVASSIMDSSSDTSSDAGSDVVGAEQKLAFDNDEGDKESSGSPKRRKLNSGEKDANDGKRGGDADEKTSGGPATDVPVSKSVSFSDMNGHTPADEPSGSVDTDTDMKQASSAADVKCGTAEDNDTASSASADSKPRHVNGRLRNGILPHAPAIPSPKTDSEGDVVMNGLSSENPLSDSKSESSNGPTSGPSTQHTGTDMSSSPAAPSTPSAATQAKNLTPTAAGSALPACETPSVSSSSSNSASSKLPAKSSALSPPHSPVATPKRPPTLFWSPSRNRLNALHGPVRRVVERPKLGYDPRCDPTVRYWWSFFETLEEYDELMDSLNVKGVREHALHRALELRREEFADSIDRRDKLIAARLNPAPPPRRSTRTRASRKRAKYTEVDEEGEAEHEYAADGVADAYVNQLRIDRNAAEAKAAARSGGRRR